MLSSCACHNVATKAILYLPSGGDTLVLEAASLGAWGNKLQAIVDHETKDKSDLNLFNLKIAEVDRGNIVMSETFPNVSKDPNSNRFVTKVLEQESNLVRVQGNLPASRPDENAVVNNKPNPTTITTNGNDGIAVSDLQISDPNLESTRKGIWAWRMQTFSICFAFHRSLRDTDIDVPSTLSAALIYCKKRRAILIVDPPSNWRNVADAISGVDGLNLRDENVGNFLPSVKMPDSNKENRLEEFVPRGVMAGVFARTDAQRGVWKSRLVRMRL